MYEAKIILDSVGPNDARLTTFELTYPRMVHSELLTHRMFSRNSASSRAIPNEKLRARIAEDPAMPVYWGANQRGMQAGGELEGQALSDAQYEWLAAREDALARSATLAELGLHKQLANRLVEPWMFITIVLTATEWSNAWSLRVNPAAQPEMEHAFHLAKDLYDKSVPQQLKSGQWHLPYVTGFDETTIIGDALLHTPRFEDEMCRISAGRCAAVSYLNQDRRDPPADMVRADKLAAAGHMSPFEHVAQAMTTDGWEAFAETAMRDWIINRIPPGNLWGWCQYRKTLKNEHDFGLITKAP